MSTERMSLKKDNYYIALSEVPTKLTSHLQSSLLSVNNAAVQVIHLTFYLSPFSLLE